MPRFYILVGDIDTWRTSFSHKIWGFSDKTKGFWNTSQEGDYLAFYVTTPVKKIIGFGKVIKKFTDEQIIFPDERFLNKPIWKYRFQFETIFVTNDWKDGVAPPSTIMLNTGRKMVNRRLFHSLLREADEKWGTRLVIEEY